MYRGLKSLTRVTVEILWRGCVGCYNSTKQNSAMVQNMPKILVRLVKRASSFLVIVYTKEVNLYRFINKIKIIKTTRIMKEGFLKHNDEKSLNKYCDLKSWSMISLFIKFILFFWISNLSLFLMLIV